MILISDGSIIIDTKINNNGAKQGINELNSMASNSAKSISTTLLGMSSVLTAIGGFAFKTGVDFESAFAGVI